MPLTPIQRDVLRALSPNRQPESHVAGGTVINRFDDSPRFSADIDVFHEPSINLRQSADVDAATLSRQGYEVRWQEQRDYLQRATITRGSESLKMEWVQDSAFRFFPVQQDPEFGYCLHPADLATNKALALGGRAEVRDFVDILHLHRTYLSLGAICWAACGKDPGFTPHALVDHAKRHMKFRDEDLAKEKLAKSITLTELKEAWLLAVDDAEHLFAALPLAEVGCLYLTSSLAPITPSPAKPESANLIRHFGSIRGAWPTVV